MNLQAITNGIIFQFVEHSSKSKKGTFHESTDWGFDLGYNFDSSSKSSRWGVVVSTGPDVEEPLEPGMKIYIDALKWTSGFEFEGETYWKTDEDHVMLIDTTV